MHNMFKDLKENKNIERKEMKAIKENQMEFSGLKNIFEIKTHWLGIKITDNAEKTSVDLKYKEKKWKKEKDNLFCSDTHKNVYRWDFMVPGLARELGDRK